MGAKSGLCGVLSTWDDIIVEPEPPLRSACSWHCTNRTTRQRSKKNSSLFWADILWDDWQMGMPLGCLRILVWCWFQARSLDTKADFDYSTMNASLAKLLFVTQVCNLRSNFSDQKPVHLDAIARQPSRMMVLQPPHSTLQSPTLRNGAALSSIHHVSPSKNAFSSLLFLLEAKEQNLWSGQRIFIYTYSMIHAQQIFRIRPDGSFASNNCLFIHCWTMWRCSLAFSGWCLSKASLHGCWNAPDAFGMAIVWYHSGLYHHHDYKNSIRF